MTFGRKSGQEPSSSIFDEQNNSEEQIQKCPVQPHPIEYQAFLE